MNRRERRRAAKTGKVRRSAAPPRALAVSEFLLGLGGQKPKPLLVPDRAALQADPLGREVGELRARRRRAAAALHLGAATEPFLSTDDLLAGLDRPGSAAVLAAAQQMIGMEFSVGWAIDLGCGMARHAEALRRLSRHIDAVDPDPARSRRAFESGAYDDSETGDLIAHLEARPDHYDLILATDILLQATDPAAVFSAVKIALALAGVFVAIADRQRHDAATWRAMAQAEGLIVLAVEPVDLPGGTAGFCLVAES